MVNADKSRIYEVISKLLSNAFKFTDEGRIVVRAEKNEQDGGRPRVLVTVRDTGPGIHPDILPRLFTKFCQQVRARDRPRAVHFKEHNRGARRQDMGRKQL